MWYVALFAAGALLNRWCDAPERFAVLVAAFVVVSSSLILMVTATGCVSVLPVPVAASVTG